MRIVCPHCSARAITRTSRRTLPVFSEVYAQCTNHACGWSGKFHLEAVLTTNPSRSPNPDVNIPVDPASRRQLLAQLTP